MRRIILYKVFCVILALGLVEAALRLGGYIMLRLNPPAQGVLKTESSGEFVVLCLGDSFTFGVGTDYQNSYPRQLEIMLNERFPKEVIKIYNLGIPGSNSSQLVNSLQRDIDKYHPGLLIVMTGRNDIWNFTDAEYPSLLIRMDSLLGHFRLYKAARILSVNLAGRAVKVKPESTGTAAEPSRKRKIIPQASQFIVSGYEFRVQGRYDLAKEYFLKALELDPGNPDANRQLGTIYREEGKYDSAEQCLKQAVAEGQGCQDKSVYTELGMIHRLQNKNELAKDEFKQAMMDARCAPLAFNELWQLYPDSGDFYREVEDFKKSIKDRDILRNIDALLKLRKNQESILLLMRGNLLKISEVCKKNNIMLMLQTYPTVDGIAQNIRKAAKKYDIALVDNYLVFQNKLKAQAKEDFFVADGHCNARGYGVIAGNIMEILVREKIFDESVNIASKD